MKQQINKLVGIISLSSKGTGYVAVGGEKNKGEDPEIDFRHLHTALHGDTVEIILHPRGKGRPAFAKGYGEARQTAEVSKIISRAKMRFVGVLEPADAKALAGKDDPNFFFLKPDDTKMYTDILIRKQALNNAKVGQKVFVEITHWEERNKMPEGKVIKVLGKPGDNTTEMNSIAIDKGFDAELPGKVEEEAKKIKERGINERDYQGRRDFRKILTFTIDPEDAKDFDDAISFRILPSLNKEGVGGGNLKSHHPAFSTPPQKGGEEYEIGIHIADVSHYVRVGSEIDNEARKRGTSVYLVDRTITMLPEALSNDLCSLVPHKDRLTMSAVFTIDKNAKVKNEWFGQTIIRSQKRFTYEEAEESIRHSGASFHKELFILNNLAKKLTKERFAQGAISLDQEEVKFVLDKNGVPIKVIKKERGDSNRLIEEFMLLANRKVAEVMSLNSKGALLPPEDRMFVYRVHDLPSKEKMADLSFFLRSLGHKITLRDGLIPAYEINKLLESLSGKNEKDTVHRAVIRSMAKAIYSTKNIGHYGLAFKYYTHFTSPIRRYPDVVVHRLLLDYLSHRKINREKLHEYEKISINASEQEKRAADAERASIKYKQVEYMSKRIGKNFEGVISGITEWGLYAEEIETKCEGLVRVRDMSDDFYIFNEKKMELLGQRKKRRYRLGDKVKIKVRGVDLERKTIDYVLV